MLQTFFDLIENQSSKLDRWFQDAWQDLRPPLYVSCDVRHAGFKMGIVDTNLFPAGFNNLCPVFKEQTQKAFGDYLLAHFPGIKKILIFAEDHTRNKFYLANIATLESFLKACGYEVRVGVAGEYFEGDEFKIQLDDQSTQTLGRISKQNQKAQLKDFVPDLIISNHDLSKGIPDFLEGIDQPIVPGVQLGWHARRKDHHFKVLTQTIREFADAFDLDPWLFLAKTQQLTLNDLTNEQEIIRLKDLAAKLLDQIKEKYAAYQINEAPYLYLKNNAGTYGMGLMTLTSAEDVLSLSRRKRNKLLSAKSSEKPTEFILQEGIPTADFYSGYPIEPVIYAVGKDPIGGFFRLHESKDAFESLNSPGMSFSCLCLHKLNQPHEEYFIDCKQKERVVRMAYFLTRLASLAAAREEQGS